MFATDLQVSAPRRALPPSRRGATDQKVVPTDQRRCRLLLIDDDDSLVYFTRRNLEVAGFVVDVAADGKRGLAAAMASNHEVVLLDHDLPLVSGIEVLRALHKAAVATPVIMITGRGNDQVAFEAGQFGAARYVTKPFGPAELISEIRSVLLTRQNKTSIAFDSKPALIDGCSQPREWSAHDRYGRWVRAMLAATYAPEDPRTIQQWAAEAKTSAATLRTWCRACALPVRRSLLLARVLRATVNLKKSSGSIEEFLDFADRRTQARSLRGRTPAGHGLPGLT